MAMGFAAVHFYCIYYDNYNYHNISHTILDMAYEYMSIYDNHSLCGYLQRYEIIMYLARENGNSHTLFKFGISFVWLLIAN